MSVRSRLAAAPWPVWLAALLGLYLLVLWPLLPDLRPGLVNGVMVGVVVAVVLRVVDDRERRKLSGWDRTQRVQVVERARRGALPDTGPERAALRRLVEKDQRDRRGSVWIITVLFGALTGVLLLTADGRSALWTVAGAGWYVVLGVVITRLELRMRAEQRAILAGLDAAGVERASPGSEGA